MAEDRYYDYGDYRRETRRSGPEGASRRFGFGHEGKHTTGSGAGGGPPQLRGWNAPARYSFMPAQQLWDQTSGLRDYLGKETQRDWEGDLFNRSKTQIDSAFSEGSRKQRQFAQRAGYGGGDTVSPLMERHLETEAAARAGQYGSAAQEAVFNAQAMRSNANREFMNYLTQMYQAYLTPAQLQVAGNAQVPMGNVGPQVNPQSFTGPIERGFVA